MPETKESKPSGKKIKLFNKPDARQNIPVGLQQPVSPAVQPISTSPQPDSMGATGLDSLENLNDLVKNVINAEATKYPKELPWEIGAVFVQLRKPAPSNKSHWMGYSLKSEGEVNLGLDSTTEHHVKIETLTAICTHSVDRPSPNTWYYYPPSGGMWCFP